MLRVQCTRTRKGYYTEHYRYRVQTTRQGTGPVWHLFFFFTIILSDVVALIILNATTAKAKPVLLVRDTQSPRAKASNLIVLLCHYLTTPR